MPQLLLLDADFWSTWPGLEALAADATTAYLTRRAAAATELTAVPSCGYLTAITFHLSPFSFLL